MAEIEKSSKRLREEDDSDDGEDWIGPLPSEAAAQGEVRKRKGTLSSRHFILRGAIVWYYSVNSSGYYSVNSSGYCISQIRIAYFVLGLRVSQAVGLLY